MYRFFLQLLFLVLSNYALAQQVRIIGVAKEYAGRKVILLKNADAISGKREVIAIKDISEAGDFSFDVSVKETQSVIISVSRMDGVLYLEPNHAYNIIFPSAKVAESKRFDRTEIPLDLTKLPENDLNLLIRKFNADYVRFIDEHYFDFVSDEFKGADVYKSTLGDKAHKSDIYKMPSANKDTTQKEVLTDFPKEAAAFMSAMEMKYAAYFDNLYFKDYVRYSLSEIKYLAGLNRKRFYQEFFHSQPVLYQNPAYIKCFDLFYRNQFSRSSGGQQEALSKVINGENDFQKLSAQFQNDSTLLDVDVRTLALLMNLKSSYYEKKFSKSAILKTLTNASGSSLNKNQSLSATNILQQLKQFDKGADGEDFTLADLKDEKWILSEQTGMPIYLFFFASWNVASIKELLLLQKLHSVYQQDVQIIVVNMDEDYEVYKKYVREHKDQKFTFLYGTGDPMLTEKYNVRSIPHAVMLDKEGKWVSYYTRKPSEGIEEDFKKLKVKGAKGTGAKTWKD